MNGSVAWSVANHVLKMIDLSDLTLPDEYYYHSLPLCVIDAVFSIGVRYEGTRRTVQRWCETQTPSWPRKRPDSGHAHTISEFVSLLRLRNPDKLAEEYFGNRQRTSPRSGILKAEAVLRFAEILQDHGIEQLGDTESDQRNAELEAEIRKIPGQRSGISFTYFLMLAGSSGFVKADRMIERFVSEAVGAPTTTLQAGKAVVSATNILIGKGYSLTPRTLDYKIWCHQRQAGKRSIGRHAGRLQSSCKATRFEAG